MKRRLYALLFALALLPMGIFAQTTVYETNPITFEYYVYLDDGDEELYINVGTSTIGGVDPISYFGDENLREWIRTNLNAGQDKFYKKNLDAITELSIDIHDAFIESYSGIIYFRNLKNLNITNNPVPAVGKSIDIYVAGSNIERVNVSTNASGVEFETSATDVVKKLSTYRIVAIWHRLHVQEEVLTNLYLAIIKKQ